MRIEEKKEDRSGQKRLIVEKSFKQIQIAERVFYQNMKAYKGSRTDTNLLNINFKTIIARVLEQACQTKQLQKDQVNAIQTYKQQSASFQNLITLIYHSISASDYQNNFPIHNANQNNANLLEKSKQSSKMEKRAKQKSICKVKSPGVLKRLIKLFESSEITRKVLGTEGTLVNKLLMLKYLEAIRYTIVGKGKIVKWKQLRSISVLK